MFGRAPRFWQDAKQARRSRVVRGRWSLAVAVAVSSLLALTACGSGGSSSGSGGSSGKVTTVKILAFKAPSLGAFLPAVIKDQNLDAAHGLNLQFTYATPDNYNTEFSAGHYPVGASAALLSEALRTERGADVTYLFNLFDYWGAVVTSDSAIHSLPNLAGHTLAAATGTTNYAMFEWFAKQAGLDLSKVQTQNQTTAGLSTMALTGRTDATELWEPAYSTLVAKKPDIRTINLDYATWKSQFNTDHIPYLGVAAQSQWAKANPKIVQALYDTYKAAADWTQKHPEQAGAVIAKSIPSGDPKVIQTLIEKNERLRMAVAPASQVSDGIHAVFKAGEQTGYLKQEPPKSVIYSGLQ